MQMRFELLSILISIFLTSGIAKTYGIANIPYALLIDKNGIIVEVNNLRGPSLDLVLKVFTTGNKN